MHSLREYFSSHTSPLPSTIRCCMLGVVCCMLMDQMATSNSCLFSGSSPASSRNKSQRIYVLFQNHGRCSMRRQHTTHALIIPYVFWTKHPYAIAIHHVGLVTS